MNYEYTEVLFKTPTIMNKDEFAVTNNDLRQAKGDI
jgi:hypothetical protein